MKRYIIITIVVAVELALITLAANKSREYERIAGVEITNAHAPQGYRSVINENIASSIRRTLTLDASGDEIKIESGQLTSLVTSYWRTYTRREELTVNKEAVRALLVDLAPSLNTEPQNGKYSMSDGGLVETSPAAPGRRLDLDDSIEAIVNALSENTGHAALEFEVIEPELNLQKLNELGITTLLSRGTSNFAGSSEDRAHNVKIGALKFDGLLVRPGDEFSFTESLGPINATAGFKPGIVIKGGSLVTEYGGGICQVSTTLFRAAMESGLPITERRAHSLPVQYYNPQGYDATIYPGVVDLKFINDTPSYILIQSKIEGTKITFEIYGRSDGRVATVNQPVVYESPGDGSLKTVLVRTVAFANGETKTERFYSSYRSPIIQPQLRNPLE